ncbi:MAG: hypothetical protein QM589_16120 [Thermomicrobiales bacterium]
MAAKLTIQPSIVLIDTQQGERLGTATIAYEKYPDEEFWLRRPGRTWERPHLFQVIGKPDADERGRLSVTVGPGEVCEAGIFQKGQGPASAKPQVLAEGTVVGQQRASTSEPGATPPSDGNGPASHP